MGFFCSEEHFDAWKGEHPEESGFVLNFHQSARICFEFYGDLPQRF